MRYLSHGQEKVIGADIKYEALTTDKYYRERGTLRRLLVNHDVDGWTQYGIWQADVEAEVV